MTPLPVPSWESSERHRRSRRCGRHDASRRAGLSHYPAYISSGGIMTNVPPLFPAASVSTSFTRVVSTPSAGSLSWLSTRRPSCHAYLLTALAAGAPVVGIGDTSVIEVTQTLRQRQVISRASSQAVPVSTVRSGRGGRPARSAFRLFASGIVTFEAARTARALSVLVNGGRSGQPYNTCAGLPRPGCGRSSRRRRPGTGRDRRRRAGRSSRRVEEDEGRFRDAAFRLHGEPLVVSSAAVSLTSPAAHGSAKSGEDYGAESGSLAFAAGRRPARPSWWP